MSQNNNPRDITAEERRAALLTAHALGQLEGDDRAEAERLLTAADNVDARRHVAETTRLADALAAARHHDLPARSADLRRAVLAAATQPRDATPTKPTSRGLGATRLLAAIGALAAAVLVAVTMLPSLDRRAVEVAQVTNTTTITTELKDTSSASAVDHDEKAEAPRTVAPAAEPRPAETSVALGKVASADGAVTVTMPAIRGEGTGFGGKAAPPKAEAVGEKFFDGHRQLAAAARPKPGANGIAASRVAVPQPASEGLLSGAPFRLTEESDSTVGVPSPKQSESRRAENRERYNHFAENAFLAPTDRPLSTFSIDVDTASYANVRRFLTAGQRPPRDAVRIEELLNYFRYGDPEPTGEVPFSVTVEAASCPWRPGHRLVRVGLKGRDVARDRRPAGNLVFLVDVSGSMGDADKLPLVKQALTMLADELTENDRVAIVTYAGEAGLRLPSTSGDQKEKIRAAIDSLSSGGSTHGSAGIELAYEQAAERFIPGGANRVILATDGDLNVGITDDAALVDLITRKAKGGTFLTVLGFGQGNLQDEKMEKLADKGNGVYAYVDGVREARKVLVEQLTGATLTIAKDVKIQVEFNPARVASYRLVGYENRALADKDFRDDTKDAGEIGAGHGVTAIYEIEVVGDDSGAAPAGAEPLKYQPPQAPKPVPPQAAAASRELLTVKLRYKQPDGDTSRLIEVPLADDSTAFDDASSDLRFASAVAAFGMLLRESSHAGAVTFPMVAKIAAAALGSDEGGYRAEFLDLVRRAEALR